MMGRSVYLAKVISKDWPKSIGQAAHSLPVVISLSEGACLFKMQLGSNVPC